LVTRAPGLSKEAAGAPRKLLPAAAEWVAAAGKQPVEVSRVLRVMVMAEMAVAVGEVAPAGVLLRMNMQATRITIGTRLGLVHASSLPMMTRIIVDSQFLETRALPMMIRITIDSQFRETRNLIIPKTIMIIIEIAYR